MVNQEDKIPQLTDIPGHSQQRELLEHLQFVKSDNHSQISPVKFAYNSFSNSSLLITCLL